MLEVIWAVGSRSGSMFAVNLTLAFHPSTLQPRAMVHTHRESASDQDPSYRTYRNQGKILEFFRDHKIRALKIEDPGLDSDLSMIASEFERAKIVSSFRPIDKIVNSHANIKPWGLPEHVVIESYVKSIELYEEYFSSGRLFMIAIEERALFSAEAFSSFLNVETPYSAQEYVSNWAVVNSLHEQKLVSSDSSPINVFASRSELQERHPEAIAAEDRYRNLARLSTERFGQRKPH